MPDTSPTPVDLDIAQRLRQIALQALGLVADLRSRASIGPDSERIREADRVVAAALAGDGYVPDDDDYRKAVDIVSALRAAGLLPGPDDIVVSRQLIEALDNFVNDENVRHWIAAALSQPHPAREQQT